MRVVTVAVTGALAVMLSAQASQAQSVYGENLLGVPIYRSDVSLSPIWISGVASCAVVESVQVHFSGTYPDEDQVSVHLYDEEFSVDLTIWHVESGAFQRTVSTTAFNGIPVNQQWLLAVQDLIGDSSNEPEGRIDEWWIRIYYKCIPSVFDAVYDNIQVLKDVDADGYAEEFAFDVVVDAVTDGAPIDVKAKLTELESGRVFWTSVWTVDDAFSNPNTIHLTDGNFVGSLDGPTWLRWDVELYSATGAELYDDFPFDLGWGPVYVEPYIPYLDACFISGFTGQDPNGNGYYETFSFDVNVDADVKAGSQYVSADITCETTSQGWHMFSWEITGTGNQVVSYTLTEQDFAGQLSGNTDLRFSVQLYDEFGIELYDEQIGIAGEPIKADGGSLVENVTVSGSMRFLDVFGETHPIRYARVTINDADPPGAQYQTSTNSSGAYSLTIPNDPDGDGTGADISVEIFTIGVPFTSPDSLQDHEIVSVLKPGSYDLHSIPLVRAFDNTSATVSADTTAPNADMFDGVFSVYDASIEGFLQAYEHFGVRMEPIVVLWPHPTTTVFVGTASGTRDTIKLMRGDRWDWDKVIHEYGHGVAEHNNIGSRNIGPPGPHDWYSDLRFYGLTDTSRTVEQAANFAFREAWPTWFAIGARLASAGEWTYHDLDDNLDFPSNYTYQLELDLDTTTAQNVAPGEVYESMNCAALWDVSDWNNDATDYNDVLSFSMDTMWSVFPVPPFPAIETLEDFWNKWFSLPIGEGTNVAMTDIFLDHQMSFIPARPICQYPLNWADTVPLNFVLKWESSPAAASYKIKLGITPCPYFGACDIEEVTSTDSFFITRLYPEIDYGWQVTAFDGYAEVESEVWNFKTGPCDCPYQGDFDENLTPNALDLNALIDVLFFGLGQVADPYCPTTRSDLNADGTTDAIDLSLIIDWLFFGDDSPTDPCTN